MYISYYPDSPPFIECVLNFAGRLRSEYGVQVEIDAWSRREIDSHGIAQWCERMHTTAKKIVIIFSPKYTEVCVLVIVYARLSIQRSKVAIHLDVGW